MTIVRVGTPRVARLRLQAGCRTGSRRIHQGTPMPSPRTAALAAALGFALCGGAQAADKPSYFAQDPYPSTYERIAAPPVLIENATVLDGNGARIDGADVLMADGRIVEVGVDLALPAGATRVDGTGKWVTPGIIDVHSHLGVYPSPGMHA